MYNYDKKKDKTKDNVQLCNTKDNVQLINQR